MCCKLIQIEIKKAYNVTKRLLYKSSLHHNLHKFTLSKWQTIKKRLKKTIPAIMPCPRIEFFSIKQVSSIDLWEKTLSAFFGTEEVLFYFILMFHNIFCCTLLLVPLVLLRLKTLVSISRCCYKQVLKLIKASF